MTLACLSPLLPATTFSLTAASKGFLTPPYRHIQFLSGRYGRQTRVAPTTGPVVIRTTALPRTTCAVSHNAGLAWTSWPLAAKSSL